jgi:hypothetical protein
LRYAGDRSLERSGAPDTKLLARALALATALENEIAGLSTAWGGDQGQGPRCYRRFHQPAV